MLRFAGALPSLVLRRSHVRQIPLLGYAAAPQVTRGNAHIGNSVNLSVRYAGSLRMGSKSSKAAGITGGAASLPYRPPPPSQARQVEPLDEEPHPILDLVSRPHTWFPAARSMRRRIICHLGPTNSGKTYHALQALKAAGSGVYCGPLRLLAWEIAERLNGAAQGTEDGCIPCNLITGQELQLVPNAHHTSSTVEMVVVNRRVDVGVLDEIQCIADPDRGFAWTRVLLGLPAAELHCCGDPSALPIVRELCRLTGDELVIKRYERLAPLTAATSHLRSFSHVQRGDCVVAFSRRELFIYKEKIERATGLRCGIIYGSLPPAVRREEARRFNRDAGAGAGSSGNAGSGSSASGNHASSGAAAPAPASAATKPSAVASAGSAGTAVSAATSTGAASAPARTTVQGTASVQAQVQVFKFSGQVLHGDADADADDSMAAAAAAREPTDVLVATDAIGMGLNLAISRVILAKTTKFDGISMRRLTVSELKQIAGRAGRYGGAYGEEGGVATAADAQSLHLLRRALKTATPLLRSAGVQPQLEHLELFAASIVDAGVKDQLIERAQAQALAARITREIEEREEAEKAARAEHAKAAAASGTQVQQLPSVQAVPKPNNAASHSVAAASVAKAAEPAAAAAAEDFEESLLADALDAAAAAATGARFGFTPVFSAAGLAADATHVLHDAAFAAAHERSQAAAAAAVASPTSYSAFDAVTGSSNSSATAHQATAQAAASGTSALVGGSSGSRRGVKVHTVGVAMTIKPDEDGLSHNLTDCGDVDYETRFDSHNSVEVQAAAERAARALPFSELLEAFMLTAKELDDNGSAAWGAAAEADRALQRARAGGPGASGIDSSDEWMPSSSSSANSSDSDGSDGSDGSGRSFRGGGASAAQRRADGQRVHRFYEGRGKGGGGRGASESSTSRGGSSAQQRVRELAAQAAAARYGPSDVGSDDDGVGNDDRGEDEASDSDGSDKVAVRREYRYSRHDDAEVYDSAGEEESAHRSRSRSTQRRRGSGGHSSASSANESGGSTHGSGSGRRRRFIDSDDEFAARAAAGEFSSSDASEASSDLSDDGASDGGSDAEGGPVPSKLSPPRRMRAHGLGGAAGRAPESGDRGTPLSRAGGFEDVGDVSETEDFEGNMRVVRGGKAEVAHATDGEHRLDNGSLSDRDGDASEAAGFDLDSSSGSDSEPDSGWGVDEAHAASAAFKRHFFFCEHGDMVDVAKAIDDVPLPFRARYIFTCAPV